LISLIYIQRAKPRKRSRFWDVPGESVSENHQPTDDHSARAAAEARAARISEQVAAELKVLTLLLPV